MKSLDDLIRHLVEEIALCGDYGKLSLSLLVHLKVLGVCDNALFEWFSFGLWLRKSSNR